MKFAITKISFLKKPRICEVNKMEKDGRWNHQNRVLGTIDQDLTQIVRNFDLKDSDVMGDIDEQHGEKFIMMLRYVLPKIRTMNEVIENLDSCLSGSISEDLCVKKVTESMNGYSDETSMRFKCCDNCGNWFKTSKMSQRFCSRNCRSSFHMREMRHRNSAEKINKYIENDDEHMKALDDMMKKYSEQKSE